jgi:hypothetical protein
MHTIRGSDIWVYFNPNSSTNQWSGHMTSARQNTFRTALLPRKVMGVIFLDEKDIIREFVVRGITVNSDHCVETVRNFLSLSHKENV